MYRCCTAAGAPMRHTLLVQTDHYIFPVSRLRNRTTIAFIVITNSVGNLLLALGTRRLPAFDPGALLPYLGVAMMDGWILAGVAVLAVSMYAQLSMFTWSDLSYVVPMTASGYVLTALLGQVFLNEVVSIVRWAGIGLISFGVVLVAETGPRTVHEPDGPVR
jgi:drug/metabolite transporter (DMT)-like permease